MGYIVGMFILLNIVSYSGTINKEKTIDMAVNIAVTVAIALASLGLGLLLRRFLVQLLRKTVLDNWIIQTLGVLIILPPLILGTGTALAVFNSQFLTNTIQKLNLDKVNYTTTVSNLIFSIILIALGIGVARTVRSLTMRGLGEKRVDVNIRTLFGRIFYILILIVVGFWILSIWQVSTSGLLASISVLTVAVTFSIQDILKDLVAGFYILLERPFYIGDQISITAAPVTYAGKVEDVQLRATKLRLITGEEVTIPNATIFGGNVVNNTFYGERRANILMTLPQEEFAKDTTPERILNLLKEFDTVMEKPEPMVLFSGFVEQKVSLNVRFWVASGQVIDLSDIMYALHEVFPQAELTIREPVSIL